MTLEPDVGQGKASSWCVTPSYKFRNEGDAVENRDEIVLFSSKANQYLRVAVKGEESEVNAGFDSLAWRVEVFDGATASDSHTVLEVWLGIRRYCTPLLVAFGSHDSVYFLSGSLRVVIWCVCLLISV